MDVNSSATVTVAVPSVLERSEALECCNGQRTPEDGMTPKSLDHHLKVVEKRNAINQIGFGRQLLHLVFK